MLGQQCLPEGQQDKEVDSGLKPAIINQREPHRKSGQFLVPRSSHHGGVDMVLSHQDHSEEGPTLSLPLKMNKGLQKTFYTCTIESITAWFRNSTKQNK